YGVNTEQPLAYSYERDVEHNLRSMTDPVGRTTKISYDERNLILTMTEAAGTSSEAMWRYTYDRNGNRASAVDPAGHRFDYVYDEWDRTRVVTLPGSPDSDRTTVALTLNRFDRADRLLISGLTAPGTTGTLIDLQTDYDQLGRPWRRRLDGRTLVLT